MTFGEKVILFNKNLILNGKLPKNIKVMNPFKENDEALKVSTEFYQKYYNDNKKRALILGINPGRHGAGLTGIPFTDTKRLGEFCNIKIQGISSHEPSSEFIYNMISEYGGVRKFYSKYYINSVSPLGFTTISDKGKTINCNYYDFEELKESLYDFIVRSIKTQISFGIKEDFCFCLGTSDNYYYLNNLNKNEKLFGEIIPLEHPRYIIQYKRKQKELYINKYIENLK